MAKLSSILKSRLEGLRTNPDGTWQARCPACAADNNGDKSCEHLRIYRSGAFSCARYNGDTDHNRAIRAFLYTGVTAEDLIQLTYVDPEPKLDIDPIYPESLLQQVVPDHTYWLNRKIDETVLRRLEGGLYPPDQHGKMDGRYIFPVRHHQTRQIMGWTGRLVSDASFGPKWKHLVKSSRSVYPVTAVGGAIRAARKVVLLESVGDMLACMTAGIDCVLVLFGLCLNSRTIGILIGANPTDIIISTNNDLLGAKGNGVGNTAADKLYTRLLPYFGEAVRIRLPQTANDWGDVLEKETGELAVFKQELGL